MSGIVGHRGLLLGGDSPPYDGWTPANLAQEPKVWLDSDSSITDVSGFASAWNDRSSNGFHYTQASAGVRPNILTSAINGKTALRLSGRYMTCSVSGNRTVMRNVSAAWAFGVFKKLTEDASSVYRTIGMWPVGSNNNIRFSMASSNGAGKLNRAGLGVRRVDADSYVSLDDSTARFGAYEIALVTMDYASRTGRVLVNGTQVAINTTLTSAGSTSDTDSNADAVLGGARDGSSVAYYADVDIACYIVGAGNLPSSEEIDKLFGWAAHYWGLASELPGGHPYKSAPPSA